MLGVSLGQHETVQAERLWGSWWFSSLFIDEIRNHRGNIHQMKEMPCFKPADVKNCLVTGWHVNCKSVRIMKQNM